MWIVALIVLVVFPANGSEAANETVLLVVADKTTPSAQDAVKRTLIQSWGYTVALIEATEPQASFDAAAAAASVAYISEEITSTDLGAKLTGAAIGVVNDEDALSDNLGIASTFGLYTSATIDITDNGHYVTAPFAVGSLTITSPAQPLHTVAGTIAAGARVLAAEPSTANGTLVIIEAGGLLTSPPGGNAAGRRVYLPWGGGNFDINGLDDNGRLLLRRSLEWGAAGRISGVVFEDANYGGGAGRNMAASAGVGRPNVDVELYGASGVYVSGTDTDVNGNYSFTGLSAGTYYVRVVTDSVRSSRTGWSTTCRPVITYRTDASSGTAVAVTDHVGGTTTSATCPGKGGAGAAFDTSTFAFTAVLTGTAQAVTKCVVSAASIAGVDFGFNYNTVVNTNNAGQGSLRQVITNANTLGGDASLAQAGLVAGKDNVVFMISNGTAAPGLRTANNYFTAGVALISPTAAQPLSAINQPLVLDARIQPGWSGTPLIRVDGASAGVSANGISIGANGDGTTVGGLMITRFSSVGLLASSGADSVRILGNWIGTAGTGTTGTGNQWGIELNGCVGALIGGTAAADGNVITTNTNDGITVTHTANTGHRILGNIIGLDPDGSTASGNGDVGIAFLSSAGGNTVGGPGAGERNIISKNFEGIEISSNNNVVQGNYFGTDITGANDRGHTSSDAVQLINGASNNRIGGTGAGEGNLIAFTKSGRHGVSVQSGSGNAVLGNRTWSNAGLGIELGNNGVSANDGARTGGAANLLMDHPVFTTATLGGNTLMVTGYVGSAPNQATFANARVEIFESDSDASGYGEGRAYLGFLTADTIGNFSGVLDVTGKGLLVGEKITGTATDASNNTSEFGANMTVSASTLSVAVSNSNFAFGIQSLNTWLTPQTSVIRNDGTAAENFVGQISQLTDGTNIWAISPTANGADSIRAQWSTTSSTGPWTNISAYASDFTIATGVAASDSVTFWLRILTPTATTSFSPFSSTLTVTAQ
jgi:hypothetical protein